MIEAKILIERDLVIKGYKTAYSLKVLRDGARFYSFRAFFVYLAVGLADSFYGASHLIGVHLYIIAALAFGASLFHYFDWTKKLSEAAKDYELHVVLNDEGVTFKNDNDRRLGWDSYDYFREREDYLEIFDKAGEISFLPKKDEFADVIVFTKSKIPGRESE